MNSHHDKKSGRRLKSIKSFNHFGDLEFWGARRVVRGIVGILKNFKTDAIFRLHNRVEGFIESRFANLSDENQRRAEALRMAESRNTPVSEQIKMIEDGQNSTLVLFSAANQLHVPVEVQNRLVDLALDNEEVMSLLANNARTDLTVLARMAEAPSLKVRQQTARMLAAHMPIRASLHRLTSRRTFRHDWPRHWSDHGLAWKSLLRSPVIMLPSTTVL